MNPILDSGDDSIFTLKTKAPGPSGNLPFTKEQLATHPSGHLFGWTQNVGMGWDAEKVAGGDYLILSTQGGIRQPDGTPVALGYHTGHFEVGLLMEEAAKTISSLGGVPFAGFVSDPCDGRTQGTDGMMDSLPYRNDAATVFRRLIRSHPTRKGVAGVATCDKGLPAMMMALASCHDLPTVLIPGGVTLLSEDTEEDLGRIQTIGARYAQGTLSYADAAEAGCRACASPGGGCQFLGTAATSQVIAEGLGLTLPHSALAPSGADIWRDMARRSGAALVSMEQNGTTTKDIITDAAIENALAVHTAFGGSTNLIMHLPAIAHQAGVRRPTVEDWRRFNAEIPRIVDALPNGPVHFATVQVFLAGGVPEVMLHLREAGMLQLDALTVSGKTVGENLEWWEKSERRRRLREKLTQLDGIDPDNVIMSPEVAASRGLTSTVTFPGGTLTPDGSIIKSTAIDPSLIDDEGIYLHEGPARVFASEPEAIAAVKSKGDDRINEGDVIVLIGYGPIGCGMPETAQLTIALKHLPWGKNVALITDGRFSGVSTGACVGHISPEAWAGGPIGKVRDGDPIRIRIDCRNMTGTVDFDGDAEELNARPASDKLKQVPNVPDDTRLWAALQNVSGGTWGGCVYDVEAILAKLNA
ncbi:YjhG/YagF family D-xylonate dehydratase [Verrucomicrobiales bacterium]|jgi:putative YjhG/YagF family dehydratase|nr:YjhG/YagF family D-xylonate dehydratase [Verrucomicrobiales bacterium]MDB2642449.1 YjhG/YagF family D-xylonate dehydratase [bacterium]MDB3939404.1 YjhG/YagF family D-xylonate dehydratase [Verrucomicrobiales bacterium]MDC0262691.1 YjhG/YagF family D-xylonate dehydratase [Verrucomicrobiales bacterium]MDC3352821.1 YjhG/YagF family D-xylonate dehydratase [Verrucomicrobiales bacterium]